MGILLAVESHALANSHIETPLKEARVCRPWALSRGLCVAGLLILTFANPDRLFADPLFGAPMVYPAGIGPSALAICDLNRDGIPDLAITNYFTSTVSVLLGHGDGTFATRTDYEAGDYPLSVVTSDLNGDGAPDLVTSSPFLVSVLLGIGDGTFAAKTDLDASNGAAFTALGDLDDDGNVDLITNGDIPVGDILSVFIGDGKGGFAPPRDLPMEFQSGYVAIGDLDGDDKLDLVSSNSKTVSIMHGNGDGTFASNQDLATPAPPRAVAIGDLNGDDKPDLVATSNIIGPFQYFGRVSVWFSLGGGNFAPRMDYASPNFAYVTVIEDLNGDNKPDLATVNLLSSAVTVVSTLLQDDKDSFDPDSDYAVNAADISSLSGPTAMASADLNGDGRRDLVITETVSICNYITDCYEVAGQAFVLLNIGPKPPADVSALLERLVAQVESNGLQRGTEHVLVLELERARIAWVAADTSRTCDAMAAFRATLDRQIPWKISREQVETLGAAAVEIEQAIGCATAIHGRPDAIAGEPVPSVRLSALSSPMTGPQRFELALTSSRFVRANVIDVTGRAVRRLSEGELGPGNHQLFWDGLSESGVRSPVGIYFLLVTAGEERIVKRVFVLR